MYRIIWLIIPVMLLSFHSYSIELFGYKLYEDITQYLNDGDVNYKKITLIMFLFMKIVY